MDDAGSITRLLAAADLHDPQAADALYHLVKDDLQRIARKRKRVVGVRGGVDASTTGLVDDAFCRLVGAGATRWQAGDRRKFFSYVSRKIHGDLIDLLRREGAEKRGGDRGREELADDHPAAPPGDQLAVLVDLQAALDRLEQFNPDGAALVRYRHFLGCTFEEAADLMGVSKTEAVRVHQRALLWLKRELKEYDLDAGPSSPD